MTWLPSAEDRRRKRTASTSPFLAGSAIVRLQPMLHAMLETVLLFDEQAEPRYREKTFTLSPGVRGGWNIGDHQLILGARGPDHVGRR